MGGLLAFPRRFVSANRNIGMYGNPAIQISTQPLFERTKLKSLGLGVAELEPEGLIALIDDLTSPTTAPQEDAVPYNPEDPIAAQAIRRDIELVVREDRLLLATERFRPTGEMADGSPVIGEVYPDRFDLRHYAVRAYLLDRRLAAAILPDVPSGRESGDLEDQTQQFRICEASRQGSAGFGHGLELVEGPQMGRLADELLWCSPWAASVRSRRSRW